MRDGYIPKEERKTLLFLADDMRLPSGIGTQTRELIINSAHRYNYIHVGGAINHPEVGKIVDISEDVSKEAGIPDASVYIYPYNGYGDADLVRLLIERHKVNAIVHFTDPRYWTWLYKMSSEIRQHVPIFYYHIWDDLPAPHYNRPYYESCDLLMGISKQSDNIARLVLGSGNYIDLDKAPTPTEIATQLPKTCFVPHGINDKKFFPMDRSSKEVQAMRTRLFNGANPEFVLFYNNRNIRRKMTSDAILAFKFFYETLPTGTDARFVLHTQSVDENGTDLPAVIDALCPELKDKIIITDTRLSTEELNVLYNCCGLSSTEGLMTGRTLINTVTGGLQDQCRFEDENGNWIEFNDEFASNHGGKYTKHGIWVKPVFPAAINLQGSIPTPYIFDDRCDVRHVAQAIRFWYDTDIAERERCGLAGREWAVSQEAGFTAESMCDNYASACTAVLDNYVAPKRFNVYNVQAELDKYKNRKTGIVLSYE